MKIDTIYTKAALAGYIDEDSNTVTAETVADYLDELKWDFIDYVYRNHDHRPGSDEALTALEENDADFEKAAEWLLEDLDDFDYAADVRRTYYFMAMQS